LYDAADPARGHLVSGGVWRAWPPHSAYPVDADQLPALRRAAPSGTEKLAELEYVVVDVETTGAGLQRGHRITEIAAVRVNGRGEVLGEFATLVNPERRIPPFITRLTNITDAMVAQAPRFSEIAGELARLLDGRVFVAHNVGFDLGFVLGELAGLGRDSGGFERDPAPASRPTIPVAAVRPAGGGLALVREALAAAGYAMVRREDGGSPAVLLVRGGHVEGDGAHIPAPARPVARLRGYDGAAPGGLGSGTPRRGLSTLDAPLSALCTVKLARRLVPEVSRRSLDVLSDFFSLANPARHRAYGDARATAALFARLLERASDRDIVHWDELQQLVRQRARRKKRSALPTSVEDV
jgi:DNA polymerase III epsilon subunit-like protein